MGGRNPAVYNEHINIDKVKPELEQIIIKFFIDLVNHCILQKTHALDASLQEKQIIFKYFNDILETPIDKFIYEFYNGISWQNTNNQGMRLIKFDDPVTGKLESKTDYNVHISLKPTFHKSSENEKKSKSDINYHISFSHGVAGQPWKSDRLNTKLDVFDFFNSINLNKFFNKANYHLFGKYLILSIYAFNFSVDDNSRDLFDNVVNRCVSGSDEEHQYIVMFINKYIEKFFEILISFNVKVNHNLSYENKQFIIFNKNTIGEVLEYIDNHNRKQCEIIKVSQERLERNIAQSQAIASQKNDAKQKEDEQIILNQSIKKHIKKTYSDLIKVDKVDELRRSDQITEFNNLLPIIRELEGQTDNKIIRNIIRGITVSKAMNILLKNLLNDKGMENCLKIPSCTKK